MTERRPRPAGRRERSRCAEPRRIGPTLRRRSAGVGQSRVILADDFGGSSSFSRLDRISAIPKKPTETPTKSMPLRRLSSPNVNRVAEV